MKRDYTVLLIAVLFMLAAPLVALAQAQDPSGASIVLIHSGSLPSQTAKPSAQFAVNDVTGVGSDSRVQTLFTYIARGMPWEALIRIAHSIMPDRELSLIIEFPLTDSIVSVEDGSRYERAGSPLFFALLSIPDVHQHMPLAANPGVTGDDTIAHGPQFVPMAAPPLRHTAPTTARGPRK